MKVRFRVSMFNLGLVALIALLLCGCSMSRGNIGHGIVTDVQLSRNNFTVLQSVTGTASHDYYLFYLGGPSDQNLLDQARRDMVNKANIKGKPRAVINVTTEIKTWWLLFWTTKTAYVSGEVVEFIN